MPYIFKEELEEGDEAVDVVPMDEHLGTLSDLQNQLDLAIEERDNLTGQLNEAKTRFADSFLSSPQRMKLVQERDILDDSEPMTFEQLFKERNKFNAN